MFAKEVRNLSYQCLQQTYMENLGAQSFSVDLINSLPDPLIHHILSFLDTKQAVRTGILSKGWRNHWKSTPSLNFHQHYNNTNSSNDEEVEEEEAEEEEEEEEEEDDDSETEYQDDDYETENEREVEQRRNFISFVERTLVLYISPTIQKFSLSLKYSDRRYGSCVDAWILFAIRRNVEELCLDFFDSYDEYKVPSGLFNCDKLVSLTLKRCLIKTPTFVSFSSLTALSIWDTTFSECMIKEILVGCPLLEDLVLVRCRFNMSYELCICSYSTHPSTLMLKRLTMRACRNFGLKVEAPKLEILNVSGSIMGKYSFRKLVSLKEAKISFGSIGFGFHVGFPDLSVIDFRHAQSLKLCNVCIQEIHCPLFNRSLYLVLSVERLTLLTGLQKYELPGVAFLLRNSPNLHTLVINLVTTTCIYEGSYCPIQLYPFDERDYWAKRPSTFASLTYSLKTVEITGFMGEESESSDDVAEFLEKQEYKLNFIRFLLEKGKVLEKMTIRVAEKPYFVEEKDWRKMVLKVGRKVKAMDRLSTNAKVLFFST